MSSDRKRIVGLGSALVDILISEDDDFIMATGFPKGGMALVENEIIERLLAKTTAKPVVVPGGSACNTAIGIARLGGVSRFVGKRGQDSYGNLFEDDLKANGVAPHLFHSASPTGRVLSVITPDAQRTMYTYLGASAETSPSEMTSECFSGAAIVHIEGYLLFNRDLMMSALKAAKEAGAQISLDLASFTVVEASRDILDNIITEYVDILIANEDEAKAYTGRDDEDLALEVLKRNVETAVLKLGKRGSMVSRRGETLRIAPQGDGAAVDTTGAGDLWASGFLYGLVNGLSMEQCGALASACGFEVCQVVGASIPEEGWERIKKIMPHPS